MSKPTERDDNPQNTPLTLPKPEMLPSNGTPTLSNAHNDHPNTHRDTHPANANTHPTNLHPFNDHRLNDNQVKTARKLGRRPHARRIAGGEGGGSLAPVPPPQDSGGRVAPQSGSARRRTDAAHGGKIAAGEARLRGVLRQPFGDSKP